MTRLYPCLIYALCLLFAACSEGADAAGARIAVATNFQPVMAKLEARFETETGFELETVTGSTGALYAQIVNGAPFDVFLAADAARPAALEAAGQGIAGTRFTYATGRLVLWSSQSAPVSRASLSAPNLRKLAIANPALAPYGQAAMNVLAELNLFESLEEKLVLGENIGQAFAFVATGNAELGFLAEAQILSLPIAERGPYWAPPQSMYRPIRQDAQLLKRGAQSQAAKAFLAYLQSDEAADLIAASGYSRP